MNLHAFIIDFARQNFDSSKNPYHAWEAINFCAKRNIPFPPWVIEYLKQCSERMKSEAQTSDLRKVLPSILSFPNRSFPNRKSGPGKLLHPSLDQKRLNFLIKFALQIKDGERPPRARENAFNAVFDRRAPNRDDETEDKTLMRWIKKGFGLKKAPKNTDTEQWQQEVFNFLTRLRVVLVRDASLAKFDDIKKLDDPAFDDIKKLDDVRKFIDLDQLETILSSPYDKKLIYHLPQP